MFSSITIEGFRGFRSLSIHGLSRLNLIVGKNNSGKSSLIEGLRILSSSGDPGVILNVALGRDDPGQAALRDDDYAFLIGAIERIFCGRNRVDIAPMSASFSTDAGDRIEIAFALRERLVQRQLFDYDAPSRERKDDIDRDQKLEEVMVADHSLMIRVNNSSRETIINLSSVLNFPRRYPRLMSLARDGDGFVPPGGLDPDSLARLWDAVALTDYEDKVITALRLIDPEIDRVSMVELTARRGRRRPVVKLRSSHRPLPLTNMGDGMTRLFGIILSAVTCKGSKLFIDEIENGLHYSVQADIWRLLLEVSRQLDIQVFATTHSWDCIEAFQKAAAETPEQDASLIRLERDQDGESATVFNEHELAIVTRESIEVR